MNTPDNTYNSPKVHICYCPACGWMLRATWLAQETLTTFSKEIDSVTLKPDYENAGLFQVWIDDHIIWCRKKEEGFPQPKELKQRIRDLICPERDLGHSDRKN
jgi:selenoprotein W-related protein